jgi:hypothetical protein
MCLNCGFYKGRVVIDLLAKKRDRDARMAAKAAARKGEEAAPEALPATTEAK